MGMFFLQVANNFLYQVMFTVALVFVGNSSGRSLELDAAGWPSLHVYMCGVDSVFFPLILIAALALSVSVAFNEGEFLHFLSLFLCLSFSFPS